METIKRILIGLLALTASASLVTGVSYAAVKAPQSVGIVIAAVVILVFSYFIGAIFRQTF